MSDDQPNGDIDPTDILNDGSQGWEVDKVVGARFSLTSGGYDFNVKWKDKNGTHWDNSWEPAGNLKQAQGPIQAYKRHNPSWKIDLGVPPHKRSTRKPKRPRQHFQGPPPVNHNHRHNTRGKLRAISEDAALNAGVLDDEDAALNAGVPDGDPFPSPPNYELHHDFVPASFDLNQALATAQEDIESLLHDDNVSSQLRTTP